MSSHRDYGERLSVLFNEQIQSEYFQNTSVSVEGTSLEWNGVGGAQHMRYFGHWSDDSKQCAAATTHNMRAELCVDGDVTKLVDGLAINGTVWKGTDGCASSYCCGKSIFGQGILSAKLGITINAQVEAPGHGKWWLDGKTGSDKRYCQECMCGVVTPNVSSGDQQMVTAKWIERNGAIAAVSPAAECVCTSVLQRVPMESKARG